MFAARGVGVSLAIFIVTYAISSLFVAGSWRLLLRAVGTLSPRPTANLFFLLRTLPLALATLVTLGITLPSFLLLEPRATDESVGAAPAILAILAVVLIVYGISRAVRAQRRTSRALEQWLNGSTQIESNGSVPVFCSRQASPTLTVAGVRDPKVIVSEATAAALSPAELKAALRHEIAHVRRYDNLKKLIFRLLVFPGTRDLERFWSEQAEMAADDAAVSSISEALDLASALIKVSKLLSPPKAEISAALLHSSTALRKRVQRLFAWRENQPTAEENVRAIWICGVPALITFLCVAVSYHSLLREMHQITEWLVR